MESLPLKNKKKIQKLCQEIIKNDFERYRNIKNTGQNEKHKKFFMWTSVILFLLFPLVLLAHVFSYNFYQEVIGLASFFGFFWFIFFYSVFLGKKDENFLIKEVIGEFNIYKIIAYSGILYFIPLAFFNIYIDEINHIYFRSFLFFGTIITIGVFIYWLHLRKVTNSYLIDSKILNLSSKLNNILNETGHTYTKTYLKTEDGIETAIKNLKKDSNIYYRLIEIYIIKDENKKFGNSPFHDLSYA